MRKQSKRRRSLYSLLGSLIAAVVLGVLGAHAFYVYLTQQGQMIAEMRQESALSIATLEKNIIGLIESYAINEYDNLVATEIELHDQLAVVVQDYRMGEVLGQPAYVSGKIRDPAGRIVDFDPASPDHRQWLERAFFVETSTLNSPSGGEVGAVTVYLADDAIQRELRGLMLRNGLTTVLIAGFLILLLLIAVRKMIVQPLSQIAAVIEDCDADGIPKAPIPDYGLREVSVLTDSMNAMVDMVRTSRLSLQAEHDSLEEALRINRLIVETIPDLLWLKDPAGVYLMCNPRFEAFLGASEQEIVGNTDYAFLDQPTADAFYGNDQAAMQSGTAKTNEEWITFASDGRRALMETTKVPLADDAGLAKGVLGIAHDITERYQAQQKERAIIQELDLERMRFQLAIDGSQDGLWDWDPESDQVFFSSQWKRMLGYADEEIGAGFDEWRQRVHPDDLAKAMAALERHLNGQSLLFEVRHRMRCKDGGWKWILARAKAQFDRDGKPVRMVGFHTDITVEMRHQEALEHSAKHDALTDLPNRFLFNELVQNLMHRSKRSQKLMALLYIDLDGFKRINDSHGHAAGDDVLMALARRMREAVRDEDVVARLGGDEFVIAVCDLGRRDEVQQLLNRLLGDLSRPIHCQGGPHHALHVSASIGVSFYPQVEEVGPEGLLRQADQAMYQAKSNGKNQYTLFNLDTDTALKARNQMIGEFIRGLKQDEFELHYQPKINMASGRVLGFEALLRWNHPQHGLRFPDSFLPELNQEKALMIKLGEWVFETAIAQLSAWLEAGWDFGLSLNVSAHEFKNEHVFRLIERLLQRYPKVEPRRLELEVLETSALEDTNEVKRMIRAGQRLGIKVALDDFGTGYSTLSYLRELPADTLKLDKSFVIEMLHDSGSFSIVEAAMGLADAFRCNVVAEGVESEEHGVMLLRLGCKVGQGYGIARPMSVDAVPRWLREYQSPMAWTQAARLRYKDRGILFAAIEHRHWLRMLEWRLEDPQRHPLPEMNPAACRFGEWLAGEALSNYPEPSLQPIRDLHHRVHREADKLLDEHQQGSLQEIRELHAAIMRKLDALVGLRTP